MSFDFEIEEAVRERYGTASQAKEEALCCPVEYDPQFLRILPDEIIERDYRQTSSARNERLRV